MTGLVLSLAVAGPPLWLWWQADRLPRIHDVSTDTDDTTLLFGFKDDVVIRVTASAGGSRVDVRSLSRVGGSDFGVNAKRIRSFLRRLSAIHAGS